MPLFAMLRILRARSIHLCSNDLIVPNLDNLQLPLRGAGQYWKMCITYRLSPDVDESKLRAGMSPQPPNLS
ncbi:hypothetical protein [Xanthomonas albilineans]|uniref:Uncharacterized protein n=2 Tax=Xanthomonas albilineans TaxID=29447 RepID=D2UDJ4_XANAP